MKVLFKSGDFENVKTLEIGNYLECQAVAKGLAEHLSKLANEKVDRWLKRQKKIYKNDFIGLEYWQDENFGGKECYEARVVAIKRIKKGKKNGSAVSSRKSNRK